MKALTLSSLLDGDDDDSPAAPDRSLRTKSQKASGKRGRPRLHVKREKERVVKSNYRKNFDDILSSSGSDSGAFSDASPLEDTLSKDTNRKDLKRSNALNAKQPDYTDAALDNFESLPDPKKRAAKTKSKSLKGFNVISENNEPYKQVTASTKPSGAADLFGTLSTHAGANYNEAFNGTGNEQQNNAQLASFPLSRPLADKYFPGRAASISKIDSSIPMQRKQPWGGDANSVYASGESILTNHEREMYRQQLLAAERTFDNFKAAADRQHQTAQAYIAQLEQELATARNALDAKKTNENNDATAKVRAAGAQIDNLKRENDKLYARLTANDNQKPDQALINDMLSELTGMMIRSIQRTTSRYRFDCILTGRNGSMPFELVFPAKDSINSKIQYSPHMHQLDTRRDAHLLNQLPDYLKEEIEFDRSQAGVFAWRLTSCLQRLPESSEDEEDGEEQDSADDHGHSDTNQS